MNVWATVEVKAEAWHHALFTDERHTKIAEVAHGDAYFVDADGFQGMSADSDRVLTFLFEPVTPYAVRSPDVDLWVEKVARLLASLDIEASDITGRLVWTVMKVEQP